MALHEDIEEKVKEYLSGTYEITKPRSVPLPEDIPLGNAASQLDAATLFMDIRQSSGITTAFRRQTAAKMMKAYFAGTVRIVNANDGFVRSFNGDGLLAIFIGENHCDHAVKAAMQVKWFVEEMLGPRFSKYFENNTDAVGGALGFDVGMGVDAGDIYAVRVGIQGTNDVAWVGRCTNTSAKLSNITESPRSIAITRKVYDELSPSRLLSDGSEMWSNESFHIFGGVRRAVRTTSYRWRL